MPSLGTRRFALQVASAALVVGSGVSVVGSVEAAITSYTVQIDASTTQPIGTGFTVSASGDDVLVIAEGSIRPFPDPGRADEGWFGPAGQTRLNRGGQPIVDGMPYGALVGGTTILPNFQFVGSRGGFRTQPGDVGQEYKVALNMSNTDLAAAEGLVTVTFVHIPAGDSDIVETILDSGSGSIVGTGLIATPGEMYMVLAYGAGNVVGLSALNDGWFTPAGQVRFNRVGQLYPEGPFGGLYGSYDGGVTGFYVGDVGSWTAQPVDDGKELSYALNMSAADASAMDGRILVRTIRIPESTSGVEEPGDAVRTSAQSFPNPMSEEAQIRFVLPSVEAVKLRIYDIDGRWIRTLIDGPRSAGENTISWDGRTDGGDRVSAGTYFYQLSTGKGSATGRLVVAR